MNQHFDAKTIVPDAALSRPSTTRGIERLLQLVTIVGEILLIAFALGGSSWETALIAHLALVTMLLVAIVALERAGADTGRLQTFALLTFGGGAVGAAAALLGQAHIWEPGGEALNEWYATISPRQEPAVTLVDKIIDGRLVRQDAQLPRPYDALLLSGTMQEKQALLAYLASENDQKFVEIALAMALRSPDQRVRVQAAAVAAHTRGRSRIRELRREA